MTKILRGKKLHFNSIWQAANSTIIWCIFSFLICYGGNVSKYLANDTFASFQDIITFAIFFKSPVNRDVLFFKCIIVSWKQFLGPSGQCKTWRQSWLLILIQMRFLNWKKNYTITNWTHGLVLGYFNVIHL